MDLNLQNKEWREYRIGDIFEVSKGIYLPKKKIKAGKTPYVTAKSLNNGIHDFIENAPLFKGNSITIGKVDLSAYYQPESFYCSHDVSVITNRHLNKYSGHFICKMINRQGFKYSYGRQAQLNVVTSEKVFLPIDAQGDPDYVFMAAYMKDVEQKMLGRYKRFIGKHLTDLNLMGGVANLDDKSFKEFEMEEIFYIRSGMRLTKADMTKGNKPFVGATDSNNGITEFTSRTNNSEDRNVLGVNYNGRVVENFYHPYTAIFSDDVKRLSFRNIEGNKYLYLFAKTQILKQRAKYQYGYKFNAKRMNKQKIMLPVNQTGTPDYVFMEAYMKRREYEKLSRYLSLK